VFAEAKTERILAVAQSEGKKHDYALFKENNRWLSANAKLLLDTGFIGVKSSFSNAVHPTKNTKLHKLTPEQRKENYKISSARIGIEHINARLKVFKILSIPYRNRRSRFGLRVNLIAAITNLMIG